MEILKTLKVHQEVSNYKRKNKLGRGYSTAFRFNPWNPLSYLVLLFASIFWFFYGGLSTIKKEILHHNPLKWH